MSGKNLANIGKSIRRIAGPNHPALMSGVVKAVQEGDGTCDVLMTGDDEVTGGVLINGVTENENGVIIIPAKDSIVWVAEIDGPGLLGIVKYSDTTKVTVKVGGVAELSVADGEVVMNGGDNGGLVVVQALVDKINRLETKLNALVTKFNSHVHVTACGAGPGTASPTVTPETPIAPATTVRDLENDKVKH